MTSEQGHWLIGVPLILIAIVLLLKELDIIEARWCDFLFPAALILGGLQGIFDKMMHGEAAPGNYEAETAQHIVQGSLVLAVGILELLRAMKKIEAKWAAYPMPLALVAVGVVFLLHAQHDSEAPMLALLVQHRALGLTFCLAGVTRALGESGWEKGVKFRAAFLTLVLLVGLQFTIYTESADGHAAPAPASSSSAGPSTH